jgi:DNA polymerase-3 subunit gamma/tau
MVLLRLLAFKPQAGSAEKKSSRISLQPIAEPPALIEQPARAISPAVIARPKPEQASPVQASPVQATNPPTAELLPWEDGPDTTDDTDVAQQALRQAVSDTPAPQASLRSLPVREASEPSVRVDVPRQPAPAQLQATPEGDIWLEMVQGMMAQEAITALVRELALQSQLVARDEGQWQLRVERETLNHPASRERLQAALLAAGHGDVKLHIEVGPVSDSPAKRLAVKAAEKMLAAQALIHSDPLVQAMVRDFGAKIVPGSIQLI